MGSITVWISEDLLDAAAVRAFFAEKGKEGGQIRAKRLSPERRKAIARKAAEIRWKKKEGRA